MASPEWTRRHATLSLERIWPRIQADFAEAASEQPEAWDAFERRLRQEWERLFDLLVRLYGGHYDFFYQLEQVVALAARSALERPEALQALDARREADPQWFQSQRMMGAMFYVDLFGGDLAGVQERIPYLKELGLSYVHLMPLFAAPEGESDGGYAVSSYRDVNPALGDMEGLSALAEALRAEGMSLVVDFVFNHTSDEHTWAWQARGGDPEYQEYYFMFPDREVPDQYERTLREIFPTVRRGSFTWYEDCRRWVWTTFNSFQWDLNYGNPRVFRAMAEEMLFLANRGVEVLRLDALAFIWKRMGTSCENLPEAHWVIQAYNAVLRIAAPALMFKSEAIVHPDEVIKYIAPGESQLSYNPLLMALCWEALATRDVGLLLQSMRHRFRIAPGCAWVNYLRCHDDIGWTFDDGDAGVLGINGYDHRQFLNRFYTGQFPGSFARGVPFQENPQTGDMRISGTLASLTGLEQALHTGDEHLLEHALRRILMLHSVILSIGGIPLIYIGDEVAMLNDYDYVHDPAKAEDSRWVHRPATDWARVERRHDTTTPEGRVYQQLTHLIRLRAECPALWGADTEFVDTGSRHLFGYTRQHGGQRLLIFHNFSEHPQVVDPNRLRLYGMAYRFTDRVSGTEHTAESPLHLGAYQFVWLDSGGQGH